MKTNLSEKLQKSFNFDKEILEKLLSEKDTSSQFDYVWKK